MCFNFIWGKRDKIKRTVIINKYVNGGLKMIDVDSHFKAIKASWVPRVFKDTDQLWNALPRFYITNATANLLPTMCI